MDADTEEPDTGWKKTTEESACRPGYGYEDDQFGDRAGTCCSYETVVKHGRRVHETVGDIRKSADTT